MKFRLVEHLSEEELQEDLKQEYEEKQSLIDEVRNILLEEGFEESKKINGIVFNKKFNKKNFSFNAQFYIDTTDDTFSSYISTEDDNNDTNFSTKGKLDNMLDGLSRLMYQLKGDLSYV